MKIRDMQHVIFTGLLFLILLPSACKSTGPALSGGLGRGNDYKIITKERTVFLYPEDPEHSPRMVIDLSLLEIPQSDDTARFIEDVLYKGESIDEYSRIQLYSYDFMYGEMQKIAKRFPDMSKEALNWFSQEVFTLNERTPTLVVISREREYYTGGAHGMREKDYHVFDLAQEKRLTLNDIIRKETKPELDGHMESALREFMEIPSWIPLSEGGFFDNPMDKLNNFFLSPKGLGFHWDPYEIAAYVMGPIEIILPYSQIEGLLTDRGLSLMNEFLR
jgi:hypothetical protein